MPYTDPTFDLDHQVRLQRAIEIARRCSEVEPDKMTLAERISYLEKLRANARRAAKKLKKRLGTNG